ncbi:uncharacterized protein [Amphiura filiformis]|uniref:uncharacterized protein n=1 Tax=Amphiura filiformis TaxID=82378 RepID=UPI003B212405
MPSKEQKKKQERKRRYEAEKAQKQQGLPTCPQRDSNLADEASPTTCRVSCSLENHENPSLTSSQVSNQEHTSEERSTDREPVTMTTAEPGPLEKDSAVQSANEIINDIEE